MKTKNSMPRWATRTAFFVATVGALVFSGCSTPSDDILDDIDKKPDTEQPGGDKDKDTQKDDFFIDLDEESHDMLQSLEFDASSGTLIMSAKTSLNDTDYTFVASHDTGTPNAKVSIALEFSSQHTYNFFTEKRDKYGVYVSPPAISLEMTIEDANGDKALFDIQEEGLEHVRVNSIDYSESVWVGRTIISWGDYYKEREDNPDYGEFLARQFYSVVQVLHQNGKDVTLEKKNGYTQEKEDVLQSVLDLDMTAQEDWVKLFRSMTQGLTYFYLEADDLMFNITEITDKVRADDIEIPDYNNDSNDRLPLKIH